MFGQFGILVMALLALFMINFGIPTFVLARDKKARKLRPLGGAEMLFNDGCAAYWKKRYRDAIRMLNHAARIRPESSMTHYYLGLSYSALGAFTEAEKAYQEALRRNPKSNMAWSELGDLYRRLNRWEDAISAYQQALQIKPDLQTAHYGLESAYACLGAKEAA